MYTSIRGTRQRQLRSISWKVWNSFYLPYEVWSQFDLYQGTSKSLALHESYLEHFICFIDERVKACDPMNYFFVQVAHPFCIGAYTPSFKLLWAKIFQRFKSFINEPLAKPLVKTSFKKKNAFGIFGLLLCKTQLGFHGERPREKCSWGRKRIGRGALTAFMFALLDLPILPTLVRVVKWRILLHLVWHPLICNTQLRSYRMMNLRD